MALLTFYSMMGVKLHAQLHMAWSHWSVSDVTSLFVFNSIVFRYRLHNTSGAVGECSSVAHVGRPAPDAGGGPLEVGQGSLQRVPVTPALPTPRLLPALRPYSR